MGERGAQPARMKRLAEVPRAPSRTAPTRATAGDEAGYEHHQRSANDIGDQQYLPSSPPVRTTPANGPTSEYGKSRTANACAAAGAVAWRSGEKNT